MIRSTVALKSMIIIVNKTNQLTYFAKLIIIPE